MLPHEYDVDTVPAYASIADELQLEIESGKYPLDSRMPSEAELCRRFKENRYTIRQALDMLVKTGVIRSHQGKGYYICEKPLNIQYTITPGTRFSDVMERLGCKPSAKLLQYELCTPPEAVARKLQLGSHAPCYRLDILRLASGVPLSLNVTWLPVEPLPDLDGHMASFRSLYALLESGYGLHLQRMSSTFEATYPSARESTLLQIPPNTNLLHIESVMRDQHNRRIEYTSAKYRGDLCRVSIEFEEEM